MPFAPLAEAAALALIFVNRFFHPDRSATGQMLTDLAVDLARSGRKGRYHIPCRR